MIPRYILKTQRKISCSDTQVKYMLWAIQFGIPLILFMTKKMEDSELEQLKQSIEGGLYNA